MLDVLRLIRSENVGSITFFQLIRRYGNARTALEAIPELASRGGSKRKISVCEKARAEQELDALTGFGARLVLYGQPDYPQHLHHIADAPPVLTVKGHAHLWQKREAIALVGARNASANGCQFAFKLARDIGGQSLLVVSGLARGIDAAAHKGALETGTVAVIASGIDQIYPPENETLHRQIMEQGAVMTEQPFGAAPHARGFPARNRIISGMALGTVVVEASFKSGSLITARVAAEQGRDVFAVPGSPMDSRCKGSNDLIRNGAILTESVADILPHLPKAAQHFASERNTQHYEAPLAHAGENDLAQVRALLLEKLGYDPVLVDELIAQCQLSAHLALVVLLELELAGRLLRHPGNRVSLAHKGNS